MALGEFKLFQWKNNKQIEREAKEYAQWAFPFGEIQKEKLGALFSELKPKEMSSILLVSFLTCKELFGSAKEETETQDDAVKSFFKLAKNHSSLVKKKDVTMYLAVVLADLEIDEECSYPSADKIRERIQELELERTL